MKIPEPAPDWREKVNMSKFFQFLGGSIDDVINKANDRYIYWDKFKHICVDCSNYATPEEAWAYLKFKRAGASKNSPVKDKEGKNFSYWLPDVLQEMLSFIDKHMAGDILVDETGIENPDFKKKFIISSLMDEAIASSQLEGAMTTKAVAKQMLRSGEKPHDYSTHMICNNYNTLLWIKRELLDKDLTPEIIKDIHSHITINTLEDESYGVFQKAGDERICVKDSKTGTILHQPPKAEDIDMHIESLCAFANTSSKDGGFIHPAIKAICLHFWLAYIHPFSDGNGRTARVLFYWYLLKNGYWLFEYLPVSSIFLSHMEQYKKAYLYTEIDDLDLTYFIMFNLKAVRLAFKDLQDKLVRKQKEFKASNVLAFVKHGLNLRQSALLLHALKHGEFIYTIKGHQNSHDVVYQTARNDLIGLEKKGFLRRQKRAAEFCFIPVEDLKEKLQQ